MLSRLASYALLPIAWLPIAIAMALWLKKGQAGREQGAHKEKEARVKLQYIHVCMYTVHVLEYVYQSGIAKLGYCAALMYFLYQYSTGTGYLHFAWLVGPPGRKYLGSYRCTNFSVLERFCSR